LYQLGDFKEKDGVKAQDQDETSAIQGCRFGDAKGPPLPAGEQAISKVDWLVSRS